MKTILIFTDNIRGHHPEFLHHIYDMGRQMEGCSFVFVVPENFPAVRGNFEWRDAANIEWEYIPTAEIEAYSKRGAIGQSKARSEIINRVAERYGATHVYVQTLMYMLPAAPWKLKRGLRMSGIIYKIYLYEKSSRLRRLADRILYRIISGSGKIERAYVLNDAHAAAELNRSYSTEKFAYLPDPVNRIEAEEDRASVRKKLGVAPEAKMLIHIGALAARKGTMDVLEAATLISKEEVKGMNFVFAGRVDEEIKACFYERVDSLRERGVNISVFDEFCSYEFIAGLCVAADAILIPYRQSAQSSGIIGYAAQYGCPVIATDEGMIGALVRDYSLGVTCRPDAEAIADACRRLEPGKLRAESRYMEEHSVGAFSDVLRRDFESVKESVKKEKAI